MKYLKSLVKRNIELAKVRQEEAIESNHNAYHFWDGYLSALESIVHVLPEDGEESEEILPRSRRGGVVARLCSGLFAPVLERRV